MKPATSAHPIDNRVKGLPGSLQPCSIEDIGAQGWNVLREDLPLPVAEWRLLCLVDDDYNVTGAVETYF
jgi:hypothetical protein